MINATSELNDLLYECFDHCADTSDPESSVSSFVRELRDDRTWSNQEVDELEATARLLIGNYRNRRQSAAKWR